MSFLLDAQLPRRLAGRLQDAGHDARHTLDLPDGKRSTDRAIVEIAEREGRVVVTKDADVVNSFVVARRPSKLLLVSTGNISNARLEALLLANLAQIEAALQASAFVELNQTALIIHA